MRIILEIEVDSAQEFTLALLQLRDQVIKKAKKLKKGQNKSSADVEFHINTEFVDGDFYGSVYGIVKE